MLNKLRAVWAWFVDGLVEALLWLLDRIRRITPVSVAMGQGEATLSDAVGPAFGRIVTREGIAMFDPPGVERKLAGAVVDIVVPDAWVNRRDLDSMAVASRPFLDAFVRHQIERLTPWRVGDTLYRIIDRIQPEDPARLSVSITVVPRRVVAPVLEILETAGPAALRLRAAGDPSGEAAIALAAGRPRLVRALRAWVLWGAAASALATVGLVGVLQWQTSAVQDDIAEQDAVLAQRNAVLARLRRNADPTGEAAERLRALRDRRPHAVEVVDALSAALPDSAHLTALAIDGDEVTIAGVSTDPSVLVQSLETSGGFAGVAFGSATTPLDGGGGDRFSLEMKAVPPRSDHAKPPPAASVADKAAP